MQSNSSRKGQATKSVNQGIPLIQVSRRMGHNSCEAVKHYVKAGAGNQIQQQLAIFGMRVDAVGRMNDDWKFGIFFFMHV